MKSSRRKIEIYKQAGNSRDAEDKIMTLPVERQHATHVKRRMLKSKENDAHKHIQHDMVITLDKGEQNLDHYRVTSAHQ